MAAKCTSSRFINKKALKHIRRLIPGVTALALLIILLSAATAIGGPPGKNPVGLCLSESACKSMFCDKNSATWPTVAPGMLNPDDALLIVAKDNRPESERSKPVRCNGDPPLKFNDDGTPKPFTTSPKSGKPITEVDFIPGVYACHSGTYKVPTAKQELIDALTLAGKLAIEKGVYLWVQTGFRSTQEQIAQACEKIKEGKGHAVGGEVAFPGGSNHGAGYAVDVTLWDAKPGFQIAKVGPSCATQWNASKVHSKLLDEIMTQAGFMRYAAEIWHYELGGPTECRCKFPDCPFPNGKEFCRICS